MKKLLSKGLGITMLLGLTHGCGASQHEDTIRISVEVASEILLRIERYADEHLAEDRERSIARGDLRAEREAEAFWSAIYNLLYIAHGYLLDSLRAGDFGDEEALSHALRCYREVITDIDTNITARGLSIAPFLHSAVSLLPKDEVRQCRY